MDILEQLRKELEQKNENVDVDYSSGVMKIADYQEMMEKQYHEGKKRGETTHITELDPHFTWKPGFVCCFTGNPNCGKSEFLLQISLIKAVKSGWKFAIYCPENMSAENKTMSPDEIADTLIHSLVGLTPDPHYKSSQMRLETYRKAIKKVSDHFIIVYPKKRIKTVPLLLDHFQYVCDQENINACIIDPWNKLHHSYQGLLDEYLMEKFAEIKEFTVKNNLVFCIVEHPKSQQKNQDGSYPMANQFSLRGGAAWNNAMDFIGSMHRPFMHEDITDSRAEFHALKIRNQKLVGLPGVVEIDFNRRENRYIFDSGSPLKEVGLEYITTEQIQGDFNMSTGDISFMKNDVFKNVESKFDKEIANYSYEIPTGDKMDLNPVQGDAPF